MPTTAVMPRPSGTDQGSMRAGIGVSVDDEQRHAEAEQRADQPATVDSVVDSVSICQTMSRRLAPSALRSPISRVRSHTTISMMFMMTMPPTTSDSETTPMRIAKMPCENCLPEVHQRVGRVACRSCRRRVGRRWRFTRSATRARPWPARTSSGSPA